MTEADVGQEDVKLSSAGDGDTRPALTDVLAAVYDTVLLTGLMTAEPAATDTDTEVEEMTTLLVLDLR